MCTGNQEIVARFASKFTQVAVNVGYIRETDRAPHTESNAIAANTMFIFKPMSAEWGILCISIPWTDIKQSGDLCVLCIRRKNIRSVQFRLFRIICRPSLTEHPHQRFIACIVQKMHHIHRNYLDFPIKHQKVYS